MLWPFGIKEIKALHTFMVWLFLWTLYRTLSKVQQSFPPKGHQPPSVRQAGPGPSPGLAPLPCPSWSSTWRLTRRERTVITRSVSSAKCSQTLWENTSKYLTELENSLWMPPFAMPVGAPLLLHIATVPFVDVDHSRPPPGTKTRCMCMGWGGYKRHFHLPTQLFSPLGPLPWQTQENRFCEKCFM